ncbi:MAG: hypothetical protein R3B47_02300 [Bacteroidia bacterium]
MNKDWETSQGLPDTLGWTANTLDFNGALVMTGNVVAANGSPDMQTTKYDLEGNISWQKEYDFTGDRDYGIAITTGLGGEIIAVGASYDTATSNFDIVIISYDDFGNILWTTRYDGGGGDIPTAVTTDSNGEIYICASTGDASGNSDFVALKFDMSGNLVWDEKYDYQGMDDIPAGMVISPNNELVITGGSQTQTGDWDYATLRYDASNGTLLGSSRQSVSGVSIDKPSAIMMDVNNNYFITGVVYDSTGAADIETIKLNDTLGVEWTSTWDGTGFDDEAHAIGLDSNGDVYVTGYTGTLGSRTLLTLKYDGNAGTVLWTLEESNGALFNGEGYDLRVDQEDLIYVSGYQEDTNGSDLYLVCYDMEGTKLWEQIQNPVEEEGRGYYHQRCRRYLCFRPIIQWPNYSTNSSSTVPIKGQLSRIPV